MFWKRTHRILGLKIKYVLYQSSGFQQGFFYSLRGQQFLETFLTVGIVIQASNAAKHPQCTEQHLTPRNYLVPNAKCPLLRNLDLKDIEGKLQNFKQPDGLMIQVQPNQNYSRHHLLPYLVNFFPLLYYSLLCGNFKYSSLNKRELPFSLPYYISCTKGFTKSISYNLQHPCKRHYSYLSGKLKNRTSR